MRIYPPNIHNQHLLPPPLLPHNHFSTSNRRNIKLPKYPRHVCSSSFDLNNFNNIITQLPSLTSTSFLTLGFASAFAIYLSNPKQLVKNLTQNKNENENENGNGIEGGELGEWILFTSPTPFNRFVTLRCPSICFEGGGVSVNERLVREERHFVRLSSGGMRVRVREGEEGEGNYTRVCVGAGDGGMISIDWPGELELEEERGLDFTVVIVAGTGEGSGERCLREFVGECLRRGGFPVVMNPRGCGGSPLTTARLFSAADSDDVSTVIEYVKNARPWSTMVAVGWGYGANMLTKYLAEVGERTPLTAATCINNPFDLEEATRGSPHHIVYDKRFTDGLIEILQSNKELFQGRTKRFDVDKALSSTSVRDFEKSISMVSYGFDDLEEFYANSSTIDAVRKVQIPTLFIQNDDGSVPMFSVPRHLIAENPFTSLLVCSSSPSRKLLNARSTLSWCQNLTIEWLTAVELGLLKGRHPLVMDVDVTINPSVGLELLDSNVSGIKSSKGKKQKVLPSNASDERSVNTKQIIFEESDTLADINTRSRSERTSEIQNNQENKENNGVIHKAKANDAAVVAEDEVASEVEKGEVLQTAEVVISMLDVTIPDTLTDKQKQKVLTAVDKGESLMKALQDVVPEDVREKLTSSVTGILQSESFNLKLEGLVNSQAIPNVASGLKSIVEGKVKAPHAESKKGESNSSQKSGSKDSEKSTTTEKDIGTVKDTDKGINEKEKSIENSDNVDSKLETGSNKTESSSESEKAGGTHDSSEKDNSKQDTKVSNSEKNIADSSTDKANVKEKPVLPASSSEDTDKETHSDSKAEAGSTKTESSSQSEGASGTHDSSEKDNSVPNDVKSEQGMSESNTDPQPEKNIADSSTDKEHLEEKPVPPAPSSEMPKDGGDIQPPNNQNSSSSTGVDVSQTLDALAGADDSTQLAVNSVFTVLEDMITQLADENENKSETKDEKNVEDQDTVSSSKEGIKHNNNEMEETSKHHDAAEDVASHTNVVSGEESTGEPVIADKCGDDNLQKVSTENHLDNEDEKVKPLAYQNPPEKSAVSSNKLVSGEESIGVPLIADKCGDDTLQKISAENSLDNKDGKIKPLSYKPPQEKSAMHLDKTSNGFILPVPANGRPLHQRYLRSGLIPKKNDNEPLDLESTSALFLEYFPEEGQWKPLEELVNEPPKDKGNDIIEPSSVILNPTKRGNNDRLEVDEVHDNAPRAHASSLKTIIMDALEIEAGRRLSATNMQEMKNELSGDIEHVANAVCMALKHQELLPDAKVLDIFSEDTAILEGENVTRVVSSALLETAILRKTLPVGVVLGSCLAAVKKYANVEIVDSSAEIEEHNTSQAKSDNFDETDNVEHNTTQSKLGEVDDTDDYVQDEAVQKDHLDKMDKQNESKADTNNSTRNAVVAGAMSAALGVSAMMSNQQPMNENTGQEPTSLDGMMSEKPNDGLVTSLAEKAMSVAGPVVPTKDGTVDQEKLVAMLAALGQRGGILRLVGKFALLWGGLRGALSLTDKLISVLRIAERPLYQRIVGFIFLVLVLWSPVVVPLLPSLVQSWTAQTSNNMAELGCIIGLYGSILMLITSWGKRIRAYEKPLEQYGLDLNSSGKVQEFLKGLIGGVVLVLLIQSLNFTLGSVNLHWPTALPLSSSNVATWIKTYGKMLVLMIKGFATATGISLVEELLFRSWLPDEMDTDLGYRQAIIISGLLFALSQRSPLAIPGLWLLSFALIGARERSKGQLWLPIGLRSGMLASSFIIQGGGYLTYQAKLPFWMTGTNPLQPFSGVIGLAAALVLALFLQPHQGKRLNRKIRD